MFIDLEDKLRKSYQKQRLLKQHEIKSVKLEVNLAKKTKEASGS